MPSFLKSSRGSMEIFIVIIIILVAFMFAGGEGFLDGAIPSEEVTPTPTTVPGSNSGSNAWSVENISTVCGQSVSSVSLGLHGTQTGYYIISVDGSAKAGFDFAPNAQNIESVTLDLPNSWGLNTKTWSVELFSGGANHAGGTSKATKNMNATNCQ